MSIRLRRRTLLQVLPACAWPGLVRGADFPERPLRMIVGYAAGGGTDMVARIVAEGMAARLGFPVIVENRPGAGGAVGATVVLQAPADGHMLMMHTPGLNQAAALGTPLPYDPVEAWAPIGLAAANPPVLVVHPQITANTLPELQAVARRAATPLRFGSPGGGLTAQLFAQGLGFQIEEVRYRGSSAVMSDLLAGRIDAYTIALPSILPYLRSGALRALGIASRRRSELMPELATTVDQGFPAIVFESWAGPVVRAGTPSDRVATLHAALNAALSEVELRRRMFDSGFDMMTSETPAAFGRVIREDHALWQQVALRGGLRQ